MNNREYFHESVVRDVVDVLTSLKDFDEVQFLANSENGNRSFKSITSATKDLILTFPVLVSSDADPANACMIAKAHEKKCASLLHILFTAICVDSNEDIFDYVKKFHHNLDPMNGTLDSYMDSLDNLAASLDEDYEYKGTIDKAALNAVLEDLKQSNYVLPDDVKEVGLDEYKIIPASVSGYNDRVILEANRGKGKNNPKRTPNPAPTPNPTPSTTTTTTPRSYNSSNTTRYITPKDLDSMTKYHSGVVLNTEYKKANEMMPTTMVINFIKKGDKTQDSMQTAVIGVKAKVYPVNSVDICNRITSKLEDKNILTNFIRATTNEIGFFRDFLFAIDKAKMDGKSYGRSASSNKLWKVLERRSVKSRFRRSLKMYNDATAITTLVLTENDVDTIKTEKGIDMYNVSYVRKLLDAYNFMGICIINEATEVISVIYDTGDDNFERLTFSNLEREASDSSYKKMVNLLTKMNR